MQTKLLKYLLLKQLFALLNFISNFTQRRKCIIFKITKPILPIILFYLFIFLKFYNLEFYYDDYWFVSVFKDSQNIIANFYKLKELYILRPVGLIYLTLLTIIDAKELLFYYIINISIWLLSSLILYLSFSRIFNKKLGLIFIFFLLFPSISSAFIFSPIIQSLSTISIFFWSISIYFLSKNRSLNDLILSIFFIILSFCRMKYLFLSQ